MPTKTHFIDDKWIEGTGEKFSSSNPATGEINWEGNSATDQEILQAVKAAAAAFEAWADRTPEGRIRYLEAYREEVRAHREEMAVAICRETGKPHWEALTEADAIAGKVGVSSEAYYERCATVTTEIAGTPAATRFKPHGVVAVFGPFNFPGHLPNGHIVPALLAGNTLVFKPSEQAPLVGEKMLELWQAAGLPKGILNMVQGGGKTGMDLASQGGLDGLFFTGSAATGKALHRMYGGRPEKILALEMGGNNPLVVYDAADHQAAAYLTIQSAFITAGQRCTCARRLIVQNGNNGRRFVDSLISMMGRIRVGPYTDAPEPFMGPVISGQAVENLLAAQDSLRKNGGEPLVEMKRLDRTGNFLSPGLMDVTDVPDRPDVELFGPLLQLIRVSDFDAAIREAGDTTYGLVAGLLSDNKDLYERFYRKIRAGVINWNRQTTGASGRMPFGGVGASGNHRPSGYYASDYCSYPVASNELERLELPSRFLPGIDL
ncbi:MAG: succinylglutamate-semialdehyde dehydrogenase [Desulfomonilaceae bacterium]